MPETRKIICTGTIKAKGEMVPCRRIIAEIEYANDVKMEIKCPKCGTMNTIQARPNTLGTFAIEHLST